MTGKAWQHAIYLPNAEDIASTWSITPSSLLHCQTIYPNSRKWRNGVGSEQSEVEGKDSIAYR